MTRDIVECGQRGRAKWCAVDFCKTQLVKQKTLEKGIDECPSISGAGKHTQLLISQCRKQRWHGDASTVKKNYDRLDEATLEAADVCSQFTVQTLPTRSDGFRTRKGPPSTRWAALCNVFPGPGA